MNHIGVLLLHGFAGNRDEVRPLYEFLNQKGHLVSMPCLPGHEGTRKELSAAKYRHWIESAHKAYFALLGMCDRVVVIGFSMGGLLAANLYGSKPFDQLITINTPVYYWDMRRILKNLAGDFKTYSKMYITAGLDKPLPALIEFQKLLSRTKPLFKGISCPALVIQAQDDDTVHPKSAEWIWNHLAGPKQLMKLPQGGHVVLQSPFFEEVLEAVWHNIDRR